MLPDALGSAIALTDPTGAIVKHREMGDRPCFFATVAGKWVAATWAMPRRSRVPLDGVPLHIVQRGRNNREPCFLCEDDYLSELRWLGQALAESQRALHDFVHMTNHVHPRLTPERTENSRWNLRIASAEVRLPRRAWAKPGNFR